MTPIEINQAFLKKRPLSYSSLKQFKVSPLHYMHYLTTPRESSPAYAIGGAVDCLIFTPDEFEKRYIVAAECDRRTKEGKAIYEEFTKLAEGKEVLKKQDFEACIAMKHSAFMNPISSRFIERCDNVQVRMEWTDKETGLPMVTIPDGIGENVIVSLKSAESAQPDIFQSQAIKYNYHLQCAIELDAMAKQGKFPNYYYVILEKSEPYAVTVMKASEDFKQYGKHLFKNLLQNYKMCLDQKLFHKGYEFWSVVDYHHLEIPVWAKKQIEQ